MCFKSVVAGAFAERQRPSTETEALLPLSSASLLEDRLNHSEVCNLSISLNFLSWEARLAAIPASRKPAKLQAGARGDPGPPTGGGRTARRLKAVQEGRVTSEDERSDQADKTWGQKGPSSKSFRDGSLGVGTAISTLGAVMKQLDHTKWWSEWLVRIGLGGVALHPSRG